MDRQIRWAAALFRLLGVFWLVGWAIYATLRDDGAAISVQGTLTDVAILLLPAFTAFLLAGLLDRPAGSARGTGDEPRIGSRGHRGRNARVDPGHRLMR